MKIEFENFTLPDGSHPELDNPHGWTKGQVMDFFGKRLAAANMAGNVKIMLLQGHMKRGTYAEEVSK